MTPAKEGISSPQAPTAVKSGLTGDTRLCWMNRMAARRVERVRQQLSASSLTPSSSGTSGRCSGDRVSERKCQHGYGALGGRHGPSISRHRPAIVKTVGGKVRIYDGSLKAEVKIRQTRRQRVKLLRRQTARPRRRKGFQLMIRNNFWLMLLQTCSLLMASLLVSNRFLMLTKLIIKQKTAAPPSHAASASTAFLHTAVNSHNVSHFDIANY